MIFVQDVIRVVNPLPPSHQKQTMKRRATMSQEQDIKEIVSLGYDE
jgi:hypothetical protein